MSNQDVVPTRTLKVNPKVTIGFSTVAGMALSISQYAGAVAAILSKDLTEESIGLLVTGTLTLATTLQGRFKQAEAAIKAQGSERAAALANAPLVSPPPTAVTIHLDGEQIAEAVSKSGRST